MPRYIADQNLQKFAEELKLADINFDKNNTCILGIDDEFSMHLTYEPNADALYLYSPLLDDLPSDPAIELELYRELLAGSLLGGQMAGGGVGVAQKEKLVLIHAVISMRIGTEDNALKNFAPLYVETVEKWRSICKMIYNRYRSGAYSEKDVELLSKYSYLNQGELPKPDQAMIEACKKKNLDDIFPLINLVHNINFTDENNLSALHYLLKELTKDSIVLEEAKKLVPYIKKLLRLHARTDLPDAAGKTIYELYAQNVRVPVEISEMIKQRHNFEQALSGLNEANMASKKFKTGSSTIASKSRFGEFFAKHTNCKFNVHSLSELIVGIECYYAGNEPKADVIEKLITFSKKNLNREIYESIESVEKNFMRIQFKDIKKKNAFLKAIENILEAIKTEDKTVRNKISRDKILDNPSHQASLNEATWMSEAKIESQKDDWQSKLHSFFRECEGVSVSSKTENNSYVLTLTHLDYSVVGFIVGEFLKVIEGTFFYHTIDNNTFVLFTFKGKCAADCRRWRDRLSARQDPWETARDGVD